MEKSGKYRMVGKRWWAAAIAALCLLVCICIGAAMLGSQDGDSMEKGTPLTDEEAEHILLGDISDEDWEIFDASMEEVRQVIAEYSSEDGYIDPNDAAAALHAVADQVDELYENGAVTYYLCTSDTVSFEFASGLAALYTPSLEGYDAGSGGSTILAFDVFSKAEFQEEGRNLWTGEYSDKETTLYYQTAGRLATNLKGAIADSTYHIWVGEAADLSELSNLPSAEILLWHGHGAFYEGSYPVLVTLEEGTGSSIAALYNYYVRECVYLAGDPGCWAITPAFVENHISLNQGFVYIASCQSGRNDELANAFMKSGAEVVFVNVGTGNIQTFYDQWMMKTIIEYMSGEYDGIYHTAEEALLLANIMLSDFCAGSGVDTLTLWNTTVDREWFSSAFGSFSSLDKFLQNMNNGTHVEYRGNGEYTLCPCIRGEVTLAEGMPEEEIQEILSSGLTVQLMQEDGSSLVSADVNVDGTFYFNDLDPKVTYVISSYGIAEQSVRVSVDAHSYTQVSLSYTKPVTLEGYVYDTGGEPLAGVTVSAERTAGEPSLLLDPTAQTNGEGYYALAVYGESTYALTYSKSGYSQQELSFEITPELFEKAQAGTPCTLADVTLSSAQQISAQLAAFAVYGDTVYVPEGYESFVSGMKQHVGMPDVLADKATEDTIVTKFCFYGDGIYYLLEGYAGEGACCQIYSCGLNGEDEVLIADDAAGYADAFIYDNVLYYEGYEYYWDESLGYEWWKNAIYQVSLTDSSSKTALVESGPYDFDEESHLALYYFDGEWLYYALGSGCYKMNVRNGDAQSVSGTLDEFSGSIYSKAKIYGDKTYYIENSALYEKDRNGGNAVKLLDIAGDDAYILSVTDSYIYYSTYYKYVYAVERSVADMQ